MKIYTIVFFSLLILSCSSRDTEKSFSVVTDSLGFRINRIDKSDSAFFKRNNPLHFDGYARLCVFNKSNTPIEYISKDSVLSNLSIRYHTISKEVWMDNYYCDFSLNNTTYTLEPEEKRCSYVFFPIKDADTLILNFSYRKHPERDHLSIARVHISIKNEEISSVW